MNLRKDTGMPRSNRRGTSWLGMLAKRPSLLAGVVVLGLTAVAASAADLAFPGDPMDMVGPSFLWPGASFQYPLGTDMLGRDMAAGLMHGARVSLLVGFVATLVSLGIGVTLGALAGYFAGATDLVIMRVTELFQTIPPFLLALAVVATLQPSIATIVIAIGAASWPSTARLVRAEVLKLRRSEMVMAAISVGVGHPRIIALYVLPNILAPIIVSASIMVATAILTESSLAFLGLGDPNIMSWGAMIGQGREVLRTDWYIAAVPGIAIIVVVLALNLLGDGLNDTFNTRVRAS
jgi:peptide/nickel transport system permease protein